ncbi:MAG: alpha/beta hydrolase [Betaproteobacteria bacterium]|nr:alpha/beta hydrolase [Betaproteobacteria bacterium]
MPTTTLIVPGLHDSGPEHWQTWFESQVPAAVRVSRIDWEAPVLARWASAVRNSIDRACGPVWLVAHSYGCLAAVLGAADRPERVAGAMLVAPADPDRFSPSGFRADDSSESLVSWMPRSQLGFASTVVISNNDPWVKMTRAAYWAECWGSRLINIGDAGHINVDSGFGPWPQGLELFRSMQHSWGSLPLGPIGDSRFSRRRRGGVLAKLRHRTRVDS